MAKLQSNFTTPEQSKLLLELGLPRESSDCYRLHYVYDDYELAEERPERMTLDELEWMLKTDNDEIDCIVPCWSYGRLIEIYNLCAHGFYTLTKVPKDLIEHILARYDWEVRHVGMNFEKLEE